MTLTCGPNEFKATITSSSAGQATQQEAFNEALRELFWPKLVDAIVDLLDHSRQECPPTECGKKVYTKPVLRATKLELAQDAQGRWACTLELELRDVVHCTKEIEVAALPAVEVPAIEAAVVDVLTPVETPPVGTVIEVSHG